MMMVFMIHTLQKKKLTKKIKDENTKNTNRCFKKSTPEELKYWREELPKTFES